MNWEISYEPEVTEKNHQHIFEGTLKERTPSKWNRCYSRELALVERPRSAGRPLGWRGVWLYEQMKVNWQSKLVSYQEIFRFTMARGWSHMATAGALGRLWRHGYLEKWVAGEWGGGWRGKYKDKAGKYHGVHYKVVK